MMSLSNERRRCPWDLLFWPQWAGAAHRYVPTTSPEKAKTHTHTHTKKGAHRHTLTQTPTHTHIQSHTHTHSKRPKYCTHAFARLSCGPAQLHLMDLCHTLDGTSWQGLPAHMEETSFSSPLPVLPLEQGRKCAPCS